MSEQPPVERTVTWTPMPGLAPRLCQCGHPHRGRRSPSKPTLAPQWTWCDAYPECACRILTIADESLDGPR